MTKMDSSFRKFSSNLSWWISVSIVLFLALRSCHAFVDTDDEDWTLPPTVYERIEELRIRGVDWLLTQRNNEFGWDLGDTPRAVLALASSVKDWPAQNDLEARLSVKQLEIELLEKLIRHDVDPVTPARISFYSLALNGACKDPRNFYGHNLIASLEKHNADQDYPGYPEAFGFSLTAFVSCVSGSHLHKKQVRHLIVIANDETSVDAITIDTRSMAIMALECFRRKRRNESLTRHIGEALKKVTRLQQPDGSFGNIHTTTMAIQALALANEVTRLNWNRTAAAIALTTMQRPDGSFLDSTHATSEAVIAATTLLNGVGLLNLKRGRCVDFIDRSKSPLLSRPIQTVTDSSSSSLSSSSLSSSSLSTSWNSQTQYTFVQSPSHANLPSPSQSTTMDGLRNSASGSGSDSGSNSGSSTIIQNPSGVITQNDTNGSHSQSQNQNQNLSHSPSSNGIIKASQDTVNAEDNKVPATGTHSNSNSMANIRYWIWIGPDPPTAEKHNISLQIPINTTFFVVMRRAAELNPNYEFSSTVWPNGHYIHTISGHREQPIGYHYWLLYHLPNDPDPQAPPPTTFVTPAGVDNLLVQDGEVYLFWYKKL